MSRLLDVVSRLITANPIVTLIVLLAVTVGLGAGFTRMAPQADNTAFLPDDSRVFAANGRIEELFGSSSSDTISTTLVFRGDALTPQGLAQMDAALSQVVSDSRVAPFLAQPNPVAAPTRMFSAALGTDDFASLTPQQIDGAAAQLPIGRVVGKDTDGSQVAISTVRLVKDVDGDGDTEDDAAALVSAELAMREIVESSQGPLEGSSLSPSALAEESQAATGSEMLLLMGLALAVIAILLLLFTRSILDLALSLLGAGADHRVGYRRPGLAGSQRPRGDGAAQPTDDHGADHAHRPGG